MELVRSSLLAFVALAATACGSSGSDSASTTPGSQSSQGPSTTPTDAQRAIAEADIIQLEGGLLFAMSKSGRDLRGEDAARGVRSR